MHDRPAQPFHCQPLAELTRQLLFAPPDKRIEQVRRAERLHDQTDPDVNYPADFLGYRITGYRSETDRGELLVGQAVLHDLRLMIDRLSRSVDMPAVDDDPIETTPALAERLGVSAKTIARWRGKGLRWRWDRPAGAKRRQIVFTRSAIDGFLRANSELVEAAGRFTQIDPQTRRQIIERARRIAQAVDVSMNRVAAHLSRKVGRSLQTVRLILEKHDREHGDDPIFADRTGPLTSKQRRVIERAHRWGIPVGRIARRFVRTRTTVYRAVRERRAARLRRVTIEYHDSPLFHREDADQVILRPEPADRTDADERTAHAPNRKSSATKPSDLPPDLEAIYAARPLPPKALQSLLVRFNFLKYKAGELRDRLDGYDPRAGDLDLIEGWLKQSHAVRTRLVCGCLPMVPPIARRHLVGREDQASLKLTDLLIECLPVVVEAVDRFDPNGKQAFESYLTWRLMRFLAGEHPSDQTLGRARRRLDGAAAADQLRDDAAALGVSLHDDHP